MLEVTELVSGYQRGSRVLDGFSIAVETGKIVALMGRNGMGKSTALKTIGGQIKLSSGRIIFDGADITGREPHQVNAAGIGYVPQGREIFGDFSVEQNLAIALIGRGRRAGNIPDWALDTFSILRERRRQRAGTLSGGQQQQLAIMRALVGGPKLLLLDEPSEGIQPSIVQEIGGVLKRFVAENNLAILLVEQNVDLVLDVADRCVFMENGRSVEEIEDVSALSVDPAVLQRYLSA